MGLSIEEVAHQAITRFALKLASHGVIPNRLVMVGETNAHRMVNCGFEPNFLDAIDVLAEDCLKNKMQAMAELPGQVNYPAAVRVVTDNEHGYSIRVILTLESGVVFDCAYRANPDKPTVH